MGAGGDGAGRIPSCAVTAGSKPRPLTLKSAAPLPPGTMAASCQDSSERELHPTAGCGQSSVEPVAARTASFCASQWLRLRHWSKLRTERYVWSSTSQHPVELPIVSKHDPGATEMDTLIVPPDVLKSCSVMSFRVDDTEKLTRSGLAPDSQPRSTSSGVGCISYRQFICGS